MVSDCFCLGNDSNGGKHIVAEGNVRVIRVVLWGEQMKGSARVSLRVRGGFHVSRYELDRDRVNRVSWWGSFGENWDVAGRIFES